MNDYGLDPYEMRMAPTMPLMSDRRTGKQFVSDPRLMQGRLILYVHVFFITFGISGRRFNNPAAAHFGNDQRVDGVCIYIKENFCIFSLRIQLT